MSETKQLTDQAAQLIEDMRTLLEQSGQFVAAQAPPLAQEIILQGRIRWTFWLSIGLIAALVGFVKVHRAWRTVGLWDSEGDHPRPQVIYLLPTVIGAITAFMAVRLFVVAWWAPRLYVLEYASYLIRGGCR